MHDTLHEHVPLGRTTVLWHSWFAFPFRHSVLNNRHVLVERIMHGQVAFRNRMGAAGLVFVDQLMHVRTQEVFRVVVDVLVMHLLAEDGRTTSRAAANAATEEDLDDR